MATLKYLSIDNMEKIPTAEEYLANNGKHRIWGCRLFDNEADARKSFG
jgi:hypothetical protein